jgi:hypothetical protein
MMEENIAQYQSAEIENQPEKRWLKIALFSVLGVVLVGGLVFAGIQVGETSRSKTPAPNNFPTNSPEKACSTEAKICPDGSAVGRTGPNCEFAPCPTQVTQDETANWKTYTNTQYNYQISYPLNFAAVTNKESSIPGILVSNSDKTITIALTAPTGTLSGNASERLTPIANLKFIIAGVTYFPEEAFYFPSEKKYRFRIVPLLKDGKSWGFDGIDIFSIESQYTKPEDIKIIDQILSTFKFIGEEENCVGEMEELKSGQECCLELKVATSKLGKKFCVTRGTMID